MPKALGPYTRAISSKNAEAQAFFNQGTQMMFAFAKVGCDPVVPRGVDRRPGLRHLLLGRGVGLGLVPEPEDGRRRRAVCVRGIAHGVLAQGKASPAERDYIDALAVRYVKDFDPENAGYRTRPTPRPRAPGREVSRRPGRANALTLRRCSFSATQGPRDVNAPKIQRLHGAFERILARDP